MQRLIDVLAVDSSLPGTVELGQHPGDDEPGAGRRSRTGRLAGSACRTIPRRSDRTGSVDPAVRQAPGDLLSEAIDVVEDPLAVRHVRTLDQRIPACIERIAQRDPFSGRVATGGVVTAEDSSWLLSWTVNRQPHFKKQPKDQIVAWVYGLFVDVNGDYVKKPLSQCTGEEITQEWLYHLGVPVEEIPELAATGARCVPVMMLYVTSFFMPRHAGDRPRVVPEGAVNFAFLGQFAETGRDTIFTTEYSVRTGMEAVYELLDVERGVPEPWGSMYDVRDLLEASARMREGKKVEIPGPAALRSYLRDRLEHGEIGQLLEEHGLI